MARRYSAPVTVRHNIPEAIRSQPDDAMRALPRGISRPSMPSIAGARSGLARRGPVTRQRRGR